MATSMGEGKLSAIRYEIDPGTSRFTVQVFASGVLSMFGHNPTIAIRGVEGEALIHPDALEESSLRLVLRAASLSVVDDISDKDRREIERQMQDEVLDSARYPEIVYECSRLSGELNGAGPHSVVLNGSLTIHGVTRSQPIPASLVISDNALRAYGDFKLLQSSYEIPLVSALAGALKVKDELKFSFDIAARRKG